MFVGHNADPLLQLAMRGPSGPMGLTGRPGPLVRIYIYSPSPPCFHAVVKDGFSWFVPVLRVLLVYQD